MTRKIKWLVIAVAVLVSFNASAQSKASLKARFLDADNAEPLAFATVSLTPQGADKVYKYSLTTEDGKASVDGIKAGTYVLKAELMGYKPYSKIVTIKENIDLGVLKVAADTEILDAARITAIGNPVIIKKDTIEYNASSFKTTDNDVLEDLLKKLPGVEVGDDGSITVNGQTVKKVTIDGKTFFLDDPQLASKNLPAKAINKVKVIEKKSEQAEFTGIDDGQEETVIDLNFKPGMKKGTFGNIMAGGGHDIPSTASEYDDGRYQVAGFMGKFSDKQQLSILINANNTNNRGFNDLSGSMMGNMRGGGGGMGRGQGSFSSGNGIRSTYMGGVNGAWDLFDDKMELGGNYLFSGSENNIKQKSTKTTYLDGKNLIYSQPDGVSLTHSYGHRVGIRLDHKFSENTSIFFEPQINFGTGNYSESSEFSTSYDYLNGQGQKLVNKGFTLSGGDNRNLNTSGRFLFRQKLGIPGRTLSSFINYDISRNSIDGMNQSLTTTYENEIPADSVINQRFKTNSNSVSVFGNIKYTEPLGNNFYLEANYLLNWKKSFSDKDTYDSGNGYLKDFNTRTMTYIPSGESFNATYSNAVENESLEQGMGANLAYQKEKFRAQLGFSAKPTRTHNSTQKGSGYSIDTTFIVWNFAPQFMLWGDFSENFNARIFYLGRSEQPAISKLMPVPDNTDPMNISFGNPTLKPSFTHSARGDMRLSNKKTFSSLNVRFNAELFQNPTVSAVWYASNGAQFSMPFNGRNSGSYNLSLFGNTPLGRSTSPFSIMNMTRLSGSVSSSYIGNNIDMTPYYNNGEMDYSAFLGKYSDIDNHSEFQRNDIRSLNVIERLKVTFRKNNLELNVSGRTRFSKSWYSVNEAANTNTFNNQLSAGANWTVEPIGLTLKSDFQYNWYRGYTTPQDDEYILNAEINKLLFKNKVTLAVKCYDILEQAKNLSITDANNYHQETWNNTLGRYIIASLTFRFGTFDKSKMMGGPMGGRGPMMPPPR